jgi:hypothetical protein
MNDLSQFHSLGESLEIQLERSRKRTGSRSLMLHVNLDCHPSNEKIWGWPSPKPRASWPFPVVFNRNFTIDLVDANVRDVECIRPFPPAENPKARHMLLVTITSGLCVVPSIPHEIQREHRSSPSTLNKKTKDKKSPPAQQVHVIECRIPG